MLKTRKQKPSYEPKQQKPLRLWPGIVIVILQWLLRFGIPIVIPGAIIIGVFGGLLCGLAIFVWWGFFSRAPRIERWIAVALMIAALFAVRPLLHESLATAGMGVLFFTYAIPVLCLAFVVWTLASRYFSDGLRRMTMVATILIACGVWILVQTGGITGGGLDSDFTWRWTETPEDKLLAQKIEDPIVLPSVPEAVEFEANWPSFRGPDRDGIIHGTKIKTDWSVSPPEELWRRPIGPGWSSFSVLGNLLYTQEQRGNDEVISCYSLITGEPVWRNRDKARFWESNGGAGPRGTPTLYEGRVYAFLDDVVFVAAAGSLVAYDTATGDPVWSVPAGGDCYSSPHLLHIDGVTQILLQNESGVIAVAPSDGTRLWEHAWPGHPIVQPIQIADGDILVSVDERTGIRRIKVAQGSDGWTTEELWTSVRLKPYFNDSVLHNGHVYGFDGPILACIDVKDGERMWKGGRYGRGQFVLLADQDLLLVLSEKGDLALVQATSDHFTELGRIPVIEGKTWNHPVLVGDILLVRNGQEMAAFRMSLIGD